MSLWGSAALLMIAIIAINSYRPEQGRQAIGSLARAKPTRRKARDNPAERPRDARRD